MSRNVVISGTDPTNPRSVADILARLEQIERDAAAMANEAGRLSLYVGFTRDVLLDQGRPLGEAGEAVGGIGRRIHKLMDLLDEASECAKGAGQDLYDTGASRSARFAWRRR